MTAWQSFASRCAGLLPGLLPLQPMSASPTQPLRQFFSSEVSDSWLVVASAKLSRPTHGFSEVMTRGNGVDDVFTAVLPRVALMRFSREAGVSYSCDSGSLSESRLSERPSFFHFAKLMPVDLFSVSESASTNTSTRTNGRTTFNKPRRSLWPRNSLPSNDLRTILLSIRSGDTINMAWKEQNTRVFRNI